MPSEIEANIPRDWQDQLLRYLPSTSDQIRRCMMTLLMHNIFEQADVRIHYVTAGTPPRDSRDSRTIVLLHGWPQTWWEWRHVMEPLRSDGWFVVAPDYRGAGGSSKPESGYDKQTMARDIKALLDHLGVKKPITLVAHDLGMLVAYAFATLYSEDVKRLVLMEAPIPGTETYESVLATTKFSQARLWHFHFHGAAGNEAETLIAGSEFPYLRNFYVKLSANPDAIPLSDAERYVADYTAPGAMRAGLELFRAFETDANDNRRILMEKGKLKMPVLGLGSVDNWGFPWAAKRDSSSALAERRVCWIGIGLASVMGFGRRSSSCCPARRQIAE
jgi:pimeloyl-ACP methyl ester carboxylesterase